MKQIKKDLLYIIIFLTISFVIILKGIFTSYPEKIFYFTAGILLFLIADYLLAKMIFDKKFKESKKLNSKLKK